MRYAQVIVDVPSAQTDRPFTYVIPQELDGLIEVGMRVLVPFGNRKLQGFVVDINNQADTHIEKIKEVVSLLDGFPILNSELLQMARWTAERFFSFQINVFNAILPNVYKSKYKKYLKLIGEIQDREIIDLFNGTDHIEYKLDDLNKTIINKINHLRKQNLLEIEYLSFDQAKEKTNQAVRTKMSIEALLQEIESLPKSSKKQYEFLKFLISELNNHSESRSWLISELGFSRSVINSAIEKGWVKKFNLQIIRQPQDFQDEIIESSKLTLNAEQQTALDAINKSAENKDSQIFLLQGITGSGKTEVYLQAMEDTIKSNRNILMLVPEISLTPQMIGRVRARFGDRVAVLHSGLNNGERYDQWRKIEKGQARIVVGTRSAVFAPLENVGLLIVDEEHDTSYKQEENPRYSAIDLIKWRSQYHKATVVLGSATPSLESRARAERGVYRLLKLTKRAVATAKLPEVEIVDMRKAELNTQADSSFSIDLINAIQDKLSRNEQIILMLNRRGYSSFMMCRDCGYIPRCVNCDIPLTMHLDNKTLRCHYCGYEESIPNVCANCGSSRIKYYGTGTEKVEEELLKLFPSSKVLRVDQDTTSKKGSLQKMLTQFENHEADILLGTQMISKGLDFKNVTLVGVINADTAIGLPDFHSGERTFQLLSQVSGRSGRAEKKGQVIIQTYNPDHYAIVFAAEQDYEKFFAQEMNLRHLGKYSPYYYTMQVMISHEKEATAAKKMAAISDFMRNYIDEKSILLGPSPRPMAKLRGKFYYQMIIKFKNDTLLNKGLDEIKYQHQKDHDGTFLSINREPTSFI